MRKNKNHILIELLWLIFIFLATLLLIRFQFEKNYSPNEYQVHIHDTYLIFSRIMVWTLLFFGITFLVFFFKEFRNSFKKTIPVLILFISGITIILALSLLIRGMPHIAFGYTIYPPLSALPDNLPKVPDNPADTLVAIAISIQFIFLVSILFAAFRWGQSRRHPGSMSNT